MTIPQHRAEAAAVMLDIALEAPGDGPEIERLLDLSFGRDRRRKVSYRYRPGIAPVARLCLVAREAGRLVGAIRHWPVRLGGQAALLLGPIAIDPARRGQGIGRALTRAALAEAEATGYRLVFLVGDPAYYAKYGFRVAPPAISMPDEDPARLQYATLAGAGLPPDGGEILRADGLSVAAGRPPVEPGEQGGGERRQALVGVRRGVELAEPGG